MIKKELVAKVSNKSGLTKKDSAAAVEAVVDTIKEALINGDEEVQIIGFGSYKLIQRAQRQGRNPQTGEAITIPTRKAVVFRPSRKLQEAVNENA